MARADIEGAVERRKSVERREDGNEMGRICGERKRWWWGRYGWARREEESGETKGGEERKKRTGPNNTENKGYMTKAAWEERAAAKERRGEKGSEEGQENGRGTRSEKQIRFSGLNRYDTLSLVSAAFVSQTRENQTGNYINHTEHIAHKPSMCKYFRNLLSIASTIVPDLSSSHLEMKQNTTRL